MSAARTVFLAGYVISPSVLSFPRASGADARCGRRRSPGHLGRRLLGQRRKHRHVLWNVDVPRVVVDGRVAGRELQRRVKRPHPTPELSRLVGVERRVLLERVSQRGQHQVLGCRIPRDPPDLPAARADVGRPYEPDGGPAPPVRSRRDLRDREACPQARPAVDHVTKEYGKGAQNIAALTMRSMRSTRSA